MLEQPASSIMEYHPSFQRMLRLLGETRRMMLCMSNYGGQTRKATVLYSSGSASSRKLVLDMDGFHFGTPPVNVT